MILVLEGLDKVGKDTAIDILKERWGAYVLRAHRPRDNSEEEKDIMKGIYGAMYECAKMNRGRVTIINRCHLSQMVYSIKRGSDDMKDERCRELSNLLFSIGAFVLYLYNGDLKEMRERMEREGEDYLIMAEREKLHQRYLQALEQSGLKYRILNITGLTKIEVADLVEDVLKMEGIV